jgi:hypothetical protein
MSNDIALLSQAPDYLKEVGIDNMTKALSGNTSVKRISIRGGVFRMMVNGEEIAKNENRSMGIVIVNGNAKVSRQFYAGKYTPGEAAAPDCWSNDGDKPDASIEYPQHSACDGCPQNIKGSGQGDSRACRFQQRLAVLLADDIEGDVFQLLLPAQSIFGRGDTDKMPFQQYAKYVGSMGRSLGTLITEMRLDSDSATPKLTFKPVGYLTREQWLTAKEKGDSPAAKAAITQTAAQSDGVKKVAAPQPAAPAKVAPVQAEEVPEPTKRVSKKAAEPAPKKDFVDVLNTWTTDDE